MDKTYILEQGILELYVLGELNKGEQRQVEDVIRQNPELKIQLDEIEAKFETLAFEQAIEAPVAVKNAIMKKASSARSNVIPMQTSTPRQNYLAVAVSISVLLLAGSIYLYSEWNSTKQQLKVVETQNRTLNTKFENLVRDFSETKSWYASINDPNTEKYILTGNQLMPEAKVVSYVNNATKTVLINTEYLPELDENHDYQMWADVDGEMIDMGVIDTKQTMLAMNYIEHSESLNITIEPAGGNDHPTVSKLITNIYLK